MQSEIYYGGSFDPFHTGHEAILAALLREPAKRLVIAPVGLQALKGLRDSPFSVHRYRLILENLNALFFDRFKKLDSAGLGTQSYQLKVAELPQTAVIKFSNGEALPVSEIRVEEILLSDEEILRRHSSYTVESLESRARQILASGEGFHFLVPIGTDIIEELPSWFEFERLFQLAEFLIIPRAGYDRSASESLLEDYRRRYRLRYRILDIEVPELSSTEIRERFRQHRNRVNQDPSLTHNLVWPDDWRGLSEVSRRYIEANGLYLNAELGRDFSAEFISELLSFERKLWLHLSLYRLAHSVNVMYCALALARVYRLDLKSTALAALLHDSAKERSYAGYSEFEHQLDPVYADYPKLIHAPFGAYLAKEEYGIEDPEICSAIYYHPCLRPDPSLLEAVVHLADKIEVGRPFRDLEEIRRLAPKHLMEAICLCQSLCIKHEEKKGARAFPESLETYQWFQTHFPVESGARATDLE
ncbi:MAG: bis(5'-nucleosyl)-tetraphosphatase (symmetrical) YqeK [Eubacteriales bacterium]|nr:bis(5'-nucleosyl)-tetraphosphatase (symmetrical) YqeK [Eubacteriales bacterium]